MNRLEQYRLSPQLMMPWHPGVTISVARAAELLGCSANTVLRMIEDGTLEGYKLRRGVKNSHYRIIRDSVLRVADQWRKEAGVISTPSAPTAPSIKPSRS